LIFCSEDNDKQQLRELYDFDLRIVLFFMLVLIILFKDCYNSNTIFIVKFLMPSYQN